MPLQSLLNALFPAQCTVCDAVLGNDAPLCATCWQQVTFISEPVCAVCGLPFEYDIGGEAQCGECMQQLPSFTRARAVLRYDEASRPLITRLKYRDHTQLAKLYAPWLSGSAATLLEGIDALIPVPLYYWRFVQRRYNQSALLAKALERSTGIPALPFALARIRATEKQTGLSRKERLKNVRRAFRVPEDQRDQVKGKRLLLIDDVYTTGATLNACAKALKTAGAAEVRALTLARRV